MFKSYTLTLFRELIESYPTWDSLKEYLASDKGGLLTVGPYKDNLVIIHYDKKNSDFTVPHVKWFRSVIWDIVQHRPVSVASPKCSPEDPLEWPAIDESYIIQDYNDGVTFNAYTVLGSPVKIATRTRFDATGKYYSNKSFSDLIVNVITNNGHNKYDSYEDILNYIQDRTYDKPDETCVSTFGCLMLTHSEHRVVEKVKSDGLTRIHSGKVLKNGDIVIQEMHLDYMSPLYVNNSSNYTKDHPANGVTVREWFEKLATERSWEWRGVVIKDGQGNRWRICSPVYKVIRSLRCSTPRADERFFDLRGKGLVKTYLIYYPEDKDLYWSYETWMRKATNDLYKLYSKVNKEHSLAYNDVDSMWKPHITALHGQYLSSLKAENKTVTLDVVIRYMNSLPTPRLLFLMNYNKRFAAAPDAAPTISETNA
jgi:hypothetical protein